jgi:hypothetical protein
MAAERPRRAFVAPLPGIRNRKGDNMRIRAGLAMAALLVTGPCAWAQVDGHQLHRFQQEAAALDDEQPGANLFRAGFYKGYVSGILEALEGRSVCLRVCRCEVEPRLARHLADHPERRDQPAAAWLPGLFEQWYPCPK